MINFTQLPLIKYPLVNKFYKLNGARGKAKSSEQVWVAKQLDIIAACRISPLGGARLLCGVLVCSAERGRGVASQLISLTCQQEGALDNLYTFAYVHIAPWYASLGFKAICSSEAPTVVSDKLALYVKQGRKLVLLKYQA